MKILVTGAAGFIGRAICMALREADHNVRGFDLVPCPDVLQPESILDYGSLVDAMTGYEAVIHCAAVLGVVNTEQRQAHTLEVNIFGTRNVVRAAEAAGVKKLVYLSSSEVYGEPKVIPTSEDDPISLLSVYAVSKIAGEEWIKTFKADWTIIRPFNVFGPGQRQDFVIPQFIERAMKGQPMTIFNGGQQTRAFCHVLDLTAAVVKMINKQEAIRKIFNIGNPANFITMRNLAILVEKLAGKSGLIKGTPGDRLAYREIRKRCPNIEKAMHILGWEPKVALRDGLKELIDAVVVKEPPMRSCRLEPAGSEV